MKTSSVIQPFALLSVFFSAIVIGLPAQGSLPPQPIMPARQLSPITPHGSDCVTPPAGLVGWWKGDGNALDSARTNIGINQNVAYTDGVVGQAFAFDPENFSYGTYTGIQIADQPAYALTNALTIEGWIRPRGDSYMIFWRGDNRPGLDPYYLSMQDNNILRFGICDQAGNSAFIDTTLNYSVWTHVAGTLDGGSGTLSIYTNGVLAAQTHTNVRPFGHLLPNQSPGIGIGNVNDGANNFPFIGDIDEISLYARALSAGEIQAIYNAGSAGKCSPTTSTNGDDCVTPPSGLVSWWKGEGNANDSVGGNNGTLVSGTYANGVVGQSFAFDGTDSYVSIPDSPVLDSFTTNITIEFWMKSDQLTDNSDWKGLVTKGNSSWRVQASASAKTVYFGLNGVTPTDLYGNRSVNDGQWHHVAAVYNGATMSLYVDGTLDASQSATGSIVQDSDPLCIGATSGAFDLSCNCITLGYFFNGLIDEASIYNRALSASEIQAIYNADSAGKCSPTTSTNAGDCVTPSSGLVSWWPAEGTANDIVSGNNGVLINGAGFANGEVGRSFLFTTTNAGVKIPASASLNVGLGNGLTIEGWINPSTLATRGYIAEWNDGNTNETTPYGVQLQILRPDEFNLGAGNLFADVHGVDGTPHWIMAAGGTISANTFQHVALTYDQASGVATLYCNGAVVAQQNLGSFAALTSYDFYIGHRPDGLAAPGSFPGSIDELSVYSRALSASEIQAIFNAGTAGKCTSTLPQSYATPQIFNLAPSVATNGALVTISGTNFNSTGMANIVYFGAVQANVISATPTSLIVKVPVGATYAPVTVTTGGLTAYSSQLFEPTFLGDGSSISLNSFSSRLDLPADSNPFKVVIADLDGDGKPDLIVANVFNNTISLYRNISTNGMLTMDSFAPRVDLVTTAGQNSPISVAAADIDGDGKLDIIALDYDNSIVSVYRNTCTPGNINSNTFSTRVDFACGFQPQDFEVKDLDGDGRADIVTANRGDGTISILRNTSETGSISTNSFAPHVDISTGSSCDSVVIGDLDGDGKPDIAVANTDDGTVSVLRNLSSPGSISAGSFAPKVDSTVASPLIRMTMGDVDGDGKLDLIVAAYGPQTVFVLRNTSTPQSLSFAPPVGFSLGGLGHTPVLADLNGDGKPDLSVVTELNSALSIFQNIGSPGDFTSNSLAPRVDFGTGWNAWGVAAGDLDGDGRPDLVFCNQYDNTISIYQNQTPLLSSVQHNPPTITAQPLNQTVLQGSSATFSVTATGPGPLTYQWKFNKANILKATNSTLTLTNLHPAQAGNYTVTVSNPNGSVTSSNAALAVTAQNVLIYNYSGTEKVTTAKQEFSYNYSGQMYFIPGSTNGIFIGWGTISGKKQYWVSPFSDYLLATIPGAANHIYTVLGKAGNNVDVNGQPHIWSYLHKGQNTTLTIANKKTFAFPGTFACNDSHVYPDPQSGVMILREATSTYTYTTQNTVTANNGGQTLADLMNAQTQTLVKQGYKPQ